MHADETTIERCIMDILPFLPDSADCVPRSPARSVLLLLLLERRDETREIRVFFQGCQVPRGNFHISWMDESIV